MVEVGILLMAAGQSSRFGSHKLLHRLSDGRPLILHTLDYLLASELPLLVIVKPEDHELHQLLARHKVTYLIHQNAGEGLGSSIAFGVKQRRDWSAWLIALADMPYISIETILKVAGHAASDRIVQPHYQERTGHPVAFGKHFQSQLTALNKDCGAAEVIQANLHRLISLSVEDENIQADVDCLNDLIKE